MSKPIKHTIHFGDTASFRVHEWLYRYFNRVKNDEKKYNQLYQFLISASKSLGTIWYSRIK